MSPNRPGNSADHWESASTLRLSPMEIDRLKRELEADTPGAEAAKRVYQRWPFEHRAVRMEVQHPGGANTVLNYVPRNLSREGIGLLHSSFVYPGTRCTVFLPHPARGEVPLGGAILRCRHFRGKVHELGIKFDQPIDVREFLGADATEGCYTLENVPPESLSGGTLLVEPGEMDRALIRQHLKETNLTVTAVTNAADALKRAGEGYDLILCAHKLPDRDGLQLLDDLRAAGIQSPFLMLCGPVVSPEDRERIRTSNADAVLAKPVAAQTLLSAVGEFLLVRSKDNGGSNAAVFTTLSARDPLSAHVPEFVAQLRLLGDQLGQAVSGLDVTECRRIAFQIRGSAPTFGFAGIADTAAQALTTLQTTGNISEASGAFRRLIAACRHAQTKRAA